MPRSLVPSSRTSSRAPLAAANGASYDGLVFRVVAVLALGACQVVFPLEEPPELLTNCSELATLSDEFDDDLVAPWINENSTRFAIENGQLLARVSNNDAVARTEPYYDLRNSSFSARVNILTPSPNGTARMSVVLLPVPGRLVDELAMQVTNGILEVGTRTNDNFTSLRSVPFSETSSVWRISYRDGTASFSVIDADGRLTEVQTLPIDLTYVRPRLQVLDPAMDLFSAAFDDINQDVSGGAACSARILEDSFEALDLQRWGRSRIENCEATFDGGLALRSVGSNWVCQLGGTTVYDLVNHKLELEIDIDPPIVAGSGFTLNFGAELSVFTSKTQRAGFQLQGDGMFGSFESTDIANTPNPPGPVTVLERTLFDSTRHRIWRLGATRDGLGDQLEFEVSADGETFSPFLKTGNLSGLDEVTVTFGAGGPNPEPYRLTIKRIGVR